MWTMFNTSYQPVQKDHYIGTVCNIVEWGEDITSSKGIWDGDNPFGFSVSVLMVQIILVFIVTRCLHFLLKPLKQPKFVSSVLGGIILGPSVLARHSGFSSVVFPRRELLVLNTMATIGVMYTIFIVAVKTDRALLLRPGKRALCLGAASLFVPFFFAMGSIAFVYNQLKIFLSGFIFVLMASLSVTPFPNLAFALDELNLLSSEMGQVAMFSAMTNDVMGWCFMAMAVVFFQKKPRNTLVCLTGVFVLWVCIVFAIRPMLLLVIKRTPEGKPVDEIYIVSILLLVSVVGFLSDAIGASIITGPLILGLVIPDGPPLGATLVTKSELMVLEFLLPLFFVVIGINTNVFAINDLGIFLALQFVIWMGYLGKFLGTLLTSLYFKMTFRQAVSVGLIMSMRGIVEVIEFTNWKVHKFADDQVYTILVLSTVAVTAIVTPLMATLYNPPKRITTTLNYSHRTITNTPRNTEVRILSCIHNEDNVPTIITILEASNPTEKSPICAYMLHLVEFVGRATPLLISHKMHKKSASRALTSSDRIVSAFNNYSTNTGGRVRIQPFTMIAPYKTMHESICKLAHEKLIPLIIIPFSMNHGVQGLGGNSIRTLNARLLANAPCTVGILVDWGLPSKTGYTNFSYHIVVLFLGGEDDREVLAYGTRMCGHPGVKVTVLRFLASDDNKGNKKERQLDDSFVKEFKLRNINSARAIYREMKVHDGSQVMDGLESLENDYDLVMVGRRRGTNGLLNEEMADWRGSVELGVIGVELTSWDVPRNKFSILVMQKFDGIDEETLMNSHDILH